MPEMLSRWPADRDAEADEDPRVARTRQHVLSTARELLAEAGPAALTHTALSARARVSRQTLYRYWPTPEDLVADLVRRRAALPVEPGADVAAVIGAYVRSLAAAFDDPAVHGAYALLMSAAVGDRAMAGVLHEVKESRRAALNEQLAPWGCEVSTDEFAMVVGPVIYLVFIAHRPVGEDVVRMVVRDTVARLRA